MPGNIWFAVPGDIETRTGGTLYDKRAIAGLRTKGWSVGHLAWPGSFPFPTDDDLRAVEASLATCPSGAIVIIDGLAFGVLPDIAQKEASRLRLVALVHHPLALETGLSADVVERFRVSERRALSAARTVVVTSTMTAMTLAADYGVHRGRITVAQPGTDKPEAEIERPRDKLVHLLSVGTVTPRKAHSVLVDALALLKDLDWQCTIAGSLDRDHHTAEALRQQISDYDLTARLTLAGEVADLTPFYRQADLMVSSSRYEGFGMAIAEALAYGLPVIAASGGAVADVIPAGAGILVSPDDSVALAAAIRRAIENPDYRSHLAEGARAAANELIGWDQTAALISSALEQV